MTTEATTDGERADLIESLDRHRYFLRFTARDLTDERAAQRTTVSQLCLGGLIKHVAATERQWARFIVEGQAAMGAVDEAAMSSWASAFEMTKGDTLATILHEYPDVADQTDDLVP